MPERRTILLYLCLLAASLASACSSEKDERNRAARLRIWRGEHAVESRKPWHEQLQPDALAAEPSVATRILGMSAEEVGKRLGSYSHKLTLSFSFNQGARRYAQEATVRVRQDASGNLYVTQDTKLSQAELYLIGGQLYVKLDNGPFRLKPAINQPVAIWRELGSRSLADAFTLLQRFATIEPPELTTHAGRAVYRYTLALDDRQVALRAQELVDATTDDPRGWRERLRPTGIRGELLIDQASSVPLRVELHGRADVLDRPVQPTSLRLHLVSELGDIGNTEAIKPPETFVPEHRRIVIDRGDRSLLDGLTDG